MKRKVNYAQNIFDLFKICIIIYILLRLKILEINLMFETHIVSFKAKRSQKLLITVSQVNKNINKEIEKQLDSILLCCMINQTLRL
jgi:hypothetical protein